MDDLAAILAGGDLSDEEMESVLTVLRGDRQALVNEMRRQREVRLAAVSDDLVGLITTLVVQRDALLRVVESAEGVLTDMPGLLDTFAGQLLARRVEYVRQGGRQVDEVISLAPGAGVGVDNAGQVRSQTA